MFRGARLPVNIFDLLKADGQWERAQYEFLNLPRGFLFQNFNGRISTPKSNRVICEWSPTVNQKIFDVEQQKYIPFTEQLWLDIPQTATFTRRPENAEQEVEYFVRSASLPKHSFIWSDDVVNTGLSWEEFSSIRGFSNQEFRGRFTFLPYLPNIKDLGHYNKFGFYEMKDDDWDFLFRI